MLILILHILLLVGLSVRLLLRDELPAPTRLAWFMVILVLPLFGGLIYFLFGEANLGYSTRDRIAEVAQSVHGQAQVLDARHVSDLATVPQRFHPAFRYSQSINGFPPLQGNAAELMPDAATARARLIADVDAATDHVHVLYYIWLDDETGINTAQALIRAAQRGVTCRAMADGLGSRHFIRSRHWEEMRAAGVQLAVALPIGNPLTTILKSRLDLRNHRKITIIDGEITHCGSQNCADPEFRVKPRYAPWVDIMLRVVGPVVAQNQLLFAADWIAHAGGTLDDFPMAPTSHTPGFVAQIMGDGPTERRLATPHLFASLINAAQEQVVISTPYFVPNSIVLESICAAAFRGVSVTLILPHKNDSWIVAGVSQSSYRRLLQAGVEIREYTGGLLHAKTLTIDGEVSLIGSSNLDLRSFDLNYESNLLLHDPATTRAILERQAEYIGSSQPVTLADVRHWPAYRRMWNNAIATLGPVL
ncbi:cardiolipin synthase [Rhodobacteraceae bacterium F11138]|nr:cardiolipin synthase [Rhodobacteraceae bacterium F11138]